jgi:hypothetical protein
MQKHPTLLSGSLRRSDNVHDRAELGIRSSNRIETGQLCVMLGQCRGLVIRNNMPPTPDCVS